MQTFMNLFQCNRRSQNRTAAARKSHAEEAERCSDVSTDALSDHSYSDHSDHSRKSLSYVAPPPGLDPPTAPASKINNAADASPHVDPEDDRLTALKRALDRLAPSDIAVVKSLLDAKAPVAARTAVSNKRSQGASCNRPAPAMSRPDIDSDWRSQRYQGPQARAAPPHPSCRKSVAAASQSTLHTAEQLGPLGISIREMLYELRSMDSSRVVMVRKINKLGLDSPKILQNYFEQFGVVERMMVSHTLTRGKNRLRPAAVGFAIMSKTEDADAARNLGELQIVDGREIIVGKFESHSIDSTD